VKSLAILSHKGGVGKTIFAVNIAAYLANQGKRVCLLDNDFHGPSIMTYFKCGVQWFNEYLNGNEKLENCLQDVTKNLQVDANGGKIFVGFADPTSEAIQNIIRIDQNSSMKMLHFLMKFKKAIQEDPYNIDYLIIDSNPGTGFSTVNVMVITDAILFVVKLNNADITGTAQMIAGLKKQLKSRTLLLANQVPDKFYQDQQRKDRFQELIEEVIEKNVQEKDIEFMGWVPTDNDLLENEFEIAMRTLEGEQINRIIHVLAKPNHTVTNTLINLTKNIFGEEV
jgi:cellulose biosynthesis protein BcsQ